MYNQNDNQQVKYVGADSPDPKPEFPPEPPRSPKGKRKGAKLSPGVKIALWIALTILFLLGYHTAAATAAFLRAGVIGKTGIDSAVAVRKILKDNPSIFFTGEDDVAFAPENLGVPPEEIRQRVDLRDTETVKTQSQQGLSQALVPLFPEHKAFRKWGTIFPLIKHVSVVIS